MMLAVQMMLAMNSFQINGQWHRSVGHGAYSDGAVPYRRRAFEQQDLEVE